MSDDARALPRAQATRIAQAFLPEARFGNRWDYYYTREKLARDPLYPGVLQALRGSRAPLLDLGCGLGLLAHALHQDGQPLACRGVDSDAGKILRAQRAAARARLPDAHFETIDLARTLPRHAGSVAILDVLQYLDADAQQRLLGAAIAMLTPGARLVIRAAIDDGSGRHGATRITDRLAHAIGWMQAVPKHYPQAHSLRALFADAGLDAVFSSLHGHMPLNHWLIVAARPA